MTPKSLLDVVPVIPVVVVHDAADAVPIASALVRGGLPFESLLNPTADLAAKLHNANLHHRDLYLCHFFAKTDDPFAFLDIPDPDTVARIVTGAMPADPAPATS